VRRLNGGHERVREHEEEREGAATMNILASNAGASSGWRAMPSRKRPPRMPKPIAVPNAPEPKMMPHASTVMAWMCAMFSIQCSPRDKTNRVVKTGT
jgi:hypothetical protein